MRKTVNITPALVDAGFKRRGSKGSPLLVTWGHPRILVVDDDPSFGRILAQYARNEGVSLAFFRSLDEVRGNLSRWRFDAAVVDSDLGNETGLEAVKYFERFLLNLPILLVSQSELGVPPRHEWPSSVRRFLPKNVGHRTILETIVHLAKKEKE